MEFQALHHRRMPVAVHDAFDVAWVPQGYRGEARAGVGTEGLRRLVVVYGLHYYSRGVRLGYSDLDIVIARDGLEYSDYVRYNHLQSTGWD